MSDIDITSKTESDEHISKQASRTTFAVAAASTEVGPSFIEDMAVVIAGLFDGPALRDGLDSMVRAYAGFGCRPSDRASGTQTSK